MSPKTISRGEKIKHSAAHILAQAILRLYPDAKLGIGPATELGFHYDFELDTKLSEKDLKKIEEEMHKISNEKLIFKKVMVPKQQAFDTLYQLGQIYKTELLQQIPDEEISFFKTGEEFIDLCRGPHVKDTSEVKHFKLTGTSQSNWLGDESRPTLTRVEGIAFATKEELTDYFQTIEEIEYRDHTKLGPALNIYYNRRNEKSLPFLLANGISLKSQIKDYLYKQLRLHQFSFVETPEIEPIEFYEETSYLDYNKELFLTPIDFNNSEMLLRPDTVNHHLKIFKYKTRGYKELPYKISEFATVYNKNIDSDGANLINSLRQTTIESQIFVTQDKAEEEIEKSIHLISEILTTLGFDKYKLEMIIPSEKHLDEIIDNKENWNKSISILENCVKNVKLPARLKEGTPPFFGPKLNFIVKDVFKREWNIANLTLDLNLPEVANINYINSENKEIHPAIIHLQLIESFEKLIALMIEHFGGEFPLWLSPVHTVLIPVSKQFIPKVRQLDSVIKNSGIRTKLDDRNETVQTKIRDAQIQKIPYMLIIGEKEIQTNSVSVRPRSGQDIGLVRIEEFIKTLSEEIESKKTL